MSEKIAVVYRTPNYSRFKPLLGNREIEEIRVRNVIKSIREIGYITAPIIVNERMEVIDGQARLEALKRLGLPVDYIVVKGTGIDECIYLNAMQRQWTLDDYITSYADRGNTSYIFLANLLTAYRKRFSLNVIFNALRFVSGFNSVRPAVQLGQFTCTAEQYSKTVAMLDYASTAAGLIDPIGGRMECYYIALCFVYSLPQVDSKRLLEKMQSKRVELLPVAKTFQALEILEKIYNSRNKDRVYLVAEFNKATERRRGKVKE